MNILIVVPSYLPAYRYGGPIESVHALAKGLVAIGHRVTVFTTDADGPGSLDVPKNAPVDVEGVEVWYFARSFPRAWYYSAAMARALAERARKFDLLYVVSVFLAASTLAARAAARAGVPCVISPRGSLMREPLRRKSSLKKRLYIALIERRNLARAAAVHFTAEAEKQEYLAKGLPLRHAIVVPNPVDAPPAAVRPKRGAFRSRYGIGTNERVVLSMGRVNWKKGFDTLVPAFRMIADADPQARLVIAGGDEEGYRATVERAVDDAGLRGKTIFTGMLTGKEKYEALADADVFVLPSYAENFGVAVLEAASAGLPVAATPQVALMTDLEKAGAGLPAEKTPEAFAGAVIRLLRDPALRKAMGERGKRLAARGFTPRAVAEQMASAWKTLLHRA